MDKLTHHESLGDLHQLQLTTEPEALWQIPEFRLHSRLPEFFFELERHTAGSIAIEDEKIVLAFLSNKNLHGQDWKKYLPQKMAADIVKTLTKIKKQWGDLGLLAEITICLKQPTNPVNQEPANGMSPTAFIEGKEANTSEEIPSGTIFLFPHSLEPKTGLGPYRGAVPEVKHLSGVITHEWAHQFMASENSPLCAEWIKNIPGWKKIKDNWVYTKPDSLPTPYSATNPVDDFVESLTLFILAPKILQTNHPERFKFCQDFAKKITDEKKKVK